MKLHPYIALVLTALGVCSTGWANGLPMPNPTAQAVAPGLWMIPGGIRPDREPDGNSVIFDAPAGLIVADTGRHEWHRQAILALARSHARSVVAIVNSHWHLDHVSGNPALRAAFPDLRVYASNALDGALKGFLKASARQETEYLNDPHIPAEMRADIRGDLLTIENGVALRPDVVITESGTVTLGGRAIQINFAPYAATSGDLWLYDGKTGVAVLGDLVTLPAPFLDTACPEGWKIALQKISATPFKIAIPGHGASMTRRQFLLYRRAFESFIECARSTHSKEECGLSWATAVRPLLATDPHEEQRAHDMAAYYVELLRSGGGRSSYCEAPLSEPTIGRHRNARVTAVERRDFMKGVGRKNDQLPFG